MGEKGGERGEKRSFLGGEGEGGSRQHTIQFLLLYSFQEEREERRLQYLYLQKGEGNQSLLSLKGGERGETLREKEAFTPVSDVKMCETSESTSRAVHR